MAATFRQEKCVICGYIGYVPEYVAWCAHGHKWPEIFICDDCRKW